ncbi:unnamed protein product [Discosporangium mesarthrocarpum]
MAPCRRSGRSRRFSSSSMPAPSTPVVAKIDCGADIDTLPPAAWRRRERHASWCKVHSKIVSNFSCHRVEEAEEVRRPACGSQSHGHVPQPQGALRPEECLG